MGEPRVSTQGRRRDVLRGFGRSDHGQILSCLTDDVAWDLPGYKHLTGKLAFDQEIENDEFVGSPTLVVDRLIEEDDTVVAIGRGETTHKSGAVHRFVFSDIFTFRVDQICRVESYLVPLKGLVPDRRLDE
ncbi:MAG: nuclear transport factor 2 family protein [Acidimicrobiales bacterium]